MQTLLAAIGLVRNRPMASIPLTVNQDVRAERLKKNILYSAGSVGVFRRDWH